jgi:type III pantothenate kinase
MKLDLDSLKLFLDNFPKENCLTYDIGNTHPHMGVFKKGILTEVIPVLPQDLKKIESNKNNIICSVSKELPSSQLFQNLKENFRGMPLQYSATLGHDRLTLASLAFHCWQKEIVIIDAGTFITIDFVSPDGFEGGHIIPGIKTLLDCYQKGEQLFTPKLEKRDIHQWPKNTHDSMAQGYQILIEGLFEKINNITRNKTLILTGGSAPLLAPYLTPALIEPHLIHYSLYFQYVSQR